MVTLMSSDHQPYEVTEEVAFMSETVKNTLEGKASASASTTPIASNLPAAGHTSYSPWKIMPRPGPSWRRNALHLVGLSLITPTIPAQRLEARTHLCRCQTSLQRFCPR